MVSDVLSEPLFGLSEDISSTPAKAEDAAQPAALFDRIVCCKKKAFAFAFTPGLGKRKK